MKMDKINRWLTVLANIGVLGGLIMVAIQIQQNTDIAKAQLANDYYLADLQLELAMMGGEPVLSWVKAIDSPGELDRNDAAVLDRYFNFGLVQINRLRRMKELGLADNESFQDHVNYLNWHLGNEFARRWWNHEKRNYEDEFIRIIDKALSDSNVQMNKESIDAMLNNE